MSPGFLSNHFLSLRVRNKLRRGRDGIKVRREGTVELLEVAET